MVYTVPEALLQEYCEFILDRYNIKLTEGQLSKFFKENGISHKKVHLFDMVSSCLGAAERSKGEGPPFACGLAPKVGRNGSPSIGLFG